MRRSSQGCGERTPDPTFPRFFQLVSRYTVDISPLIGIVFLTRKVSGYRIKPFRHDGRNQTRRQSLILQSANARSSLASNPPFSVGFDPQGGSESRTAHLPAFAVIGFSSGWGTIPSSPGGIDPRANGSFLIDERRGENETGDSASARKRTSPFAGRKKRKLSFLARI